MVKKTDLDAHVRREMAAMATIYSALQKLDRPAQRWVLSCVMERLGITQGAAVRDEAAAASEAETHQPSHVAMPVSQVSSSKPTDGGGTVEGVSPVAAKWMLRSGLTAAELSQLFSLGLDEIDLVAKKVPGRSKKDRMRNVFLLKGIAEYLSSGVARISFDKIKEACTHYDAYDTANFAAYVRTLSREIGGTRESGFTLTTAGMTSATELIMELTNLESEPSGSGRKTPDKRRKGRKS